MYFIVFKNKAKKPPWLSPDRRPQCLKLRDVAFKNDGRARNAVMIPASAVANLQALVSPHEAVSRAGLTVVRLLSFVDFDTDDQRFNASH
jgi:hypothetical protein